MVSEEEVNTGINTFGECAHNYLVAVLESCSEALYCLCGHNTLFLMIPLNNSLYKNEFLNCSVLEVGTLYPFELFTTDFSTMFDDWKFSKLSSFNVSFWFFDG